MAKVLDSMQRLPNGTELVRWHLLDDNYQLLQFVCSEHLAAITPHPIRVEGIPLLV